MFDGQKHAQNLQSVSTFSDKNPRDIPKLPAIKGGLPRGFCGSRGSRGSRTGAGRSAGRSAGLSTGRSAGRSVSGRRGDRPGLGFDLLKMGGDGVGSDS